MVPLEQKWKRWLTTNLQACIALPSSVPVSGSWLRIAALLRGSRVWLFETCGMETGVPAELCRVREALSKAETVDRSTVTAWLALCRVVVLLNSCPHDKWENNRMRPIDKVMYFKPNLLPCVYFLVFRKRQSADIQHDRNTVRRS